MAPTSAAATALHRGTEIVLPASVFTANFAKTDALDVVWAAPLALAAPPIADIAFLFGKELDE